MYIVLSTRVLFNPLMQPINEAQLLNINFLSQFFAAAADAVFPTNIVPLGSIYASLY